MASTPAANVRPTSWGTSPPAPPARSSEAIAPSAPWPSPPAASRWGPSPPPPSTTATVTRAGRKIGTARRKERRDAEGTDHVTFGIELFVTVEDDDRAQLVVGLTALLEKHAKDQGWFGT